jgi:RNA polymerase sigma factor (sigma-70 family)
MLEDAMEDLRNGNKDAMDIIYSETSKMVFSLLYSYLGDYSLSEDLLQDTYLTVYTKINQYSPKTNPQAWMMTIAKNLAKNELKKRKKTKFVSPEDFDSVPESTSEPDPKSYELVRFVKAILKEEDCKIVLLHTIGEMKLKDIAILLKKPEGTIRWKYQKALEKVRTELERRNQDDTKGY